MSRPSVERLVSSQIAAMRDALRVFADAFDEEENFFSAPPSDDYLEHLLSDPRFVLLVARIDGEVVGALSAYELVKYERERSEFYIYDLAVAETFRRRGIATALIEALKPIARVQSPFGRSSRGARSAEHIVYRPDPAL